MTQSTKRRDPRPFATGLRPETEGTGAKVAATTTRGDSVEGSPESPRGDTGVYFAIP
jgi:hypothetical protein